MVWWQVLRGSLLFNAEIGQVLRAILCWFLLSFWSNLSPPDSWLTWTTALFEAKLPIVPKSCLIIYSQLKSCSGVPRTSKRYKLPSHRKPFPVCKKEAIQLLEDFNEFEWFCKAECRKCFCSEWFSVSHSPWLTLDRMTAISHWPRCHGNDRRRRWWGETCRESWNHVALCSISCCTFLHLLSGTGGASQERPFLLV